MRPGWFRPSNTKLGGRLWSPAQGYSIAAASYDRWYWQAFWAANEAPLVASAIRPTEAPLLALDAGAGTGEYLPLIGSRGYRAVGLDLAMPMLRLARGKTSPAGLVCASLLQCPFGHATFELVVACRVLSHVRDVGAALSELGRVTREGGVALVSDVAKSHRYTDTRIPTPEGDVHIETHKRSARDLAAAAVATGSWAVDLLTEVSFRELARQPADGEYPSLDPQSPRAIFFLIVLRRLSR